MSTLTARRALVKSNSAAREVNIIDWCYRIIGQGADAAPNHRTPAIALLNEDSQLGRTFVPPLAESIQALRDRQEESGTVADRPLAVAHVAHDFEPSKSDSRWWAAEAAKIADARISLCRQHRTAGRRMGRENGTAMAFTRSV